MSRIFAPFLIDNYKAGHIVMEPAGLTKVYSNFTPRNDHYAAKLPDFDGKMTVFGLQRFIQEVLIDQWNDTFFRKPRDYVMDRYRRRMDSTFGPNVIPAEQFGALHDLGYLPIHIKSMPEGSRIPMQVPMLTITNTHDEFAWLTNYLETITSCETWKPSVAASTAFEFRRLFERYARETGGDMNAIPFQGHDFSMRGMSGVEDAANTGIGHLLSFYGTDTLPAIEKACEYYMADESIEPIGASVPATEHSTMCLGGKVKERDTYRRLIQDLFPTGIVSIVSDTWDYFRVLTEYTRDLRDIIRARGPRGAQPGKVVFRPDSGDPLHIITGDPNAPIGSPEYKGSLECLWEVFGGTINAQGFRVIDPCVGLIYGDSITLDRAQAILARMKEIGFAGTNIVFGMGSFTYQLVTRDNFSIAAKATYGVINGVGVEIQKDPKTGGGKKSARGLLRVEAVGDTFVLHEQQTPEQEQGGVLRTTFLNGQAYNTESIHTIRQRLLAQLY